MGFLKVEIREERVGVSRRTEVNNGSLVPNQEREIGTTGIRN